MRLAAPALLALVGTGAACPGNYEDYRMVEGVSAPFASPSGDGLVCHAGISWILQSRDTDEGSSWRRRGDPLVSVACGEDHAYRPEDRADVDIEGLEAAGELEIVMSGFEPGERASRLVLVERSGVRLEDGLLSADYRRVFELTWPLLRGPGGTDAMPLAFAIEASGVFEVEGFCDEVACRPDRSSLVGQPR